MCEWARFRSSTRRPRNRRSERSFWKEFLSLPKWKWSRGNFFLLTCILYMLLLLGLLYLLIHA
jgi:hypothetical protein